MTEDTGWSFFEGLFPFSESGPRATDTLRPPTLIILLSTQYHKSKPNQRGPTSPPSPSSGFESERRLFSDLLPATFSFSVAAAVMSIVLDIFDEDDDDRQLPVRLEGCHEHSFRHF